VSGERADTSSVPRRESRLSLSPSPSAARRRGWAALPRLREGCGGEEWRSRVRGRVARGGGFYSGGGFG
jgi:hypothetical protein